jgi:hypothetical protein
MSDLEHARSLLGKARDDVNALRGMVIPALASSHEFFSDEVYGFHAQQAAEKCLKAWIVSVTVSDRTTFSASSVPRCNRLISANQFPTANSLKLW